MGVLERTGEVGSTPYLNAALLAAPQLVAGPRPAGGVLPRVITSIVLANPHNALVYLQLFDAATAGAVTVGTTPPTQSYPVPANNGFLQLALDEWGPAFKNGIVVAATTGPTNATAPGTGLVVNLTYA